MLKTSKICYIIKNVTLWLVNFQQTKLKLSHQSSFNNELFQFHNMAIITWLHGQSKSPINFAVKQMNRIQDICDKVWWVSPFGFLSWCWGCTKYSHQNICLFESLKSLLPEGGIPAVMYFAGTMRWSMGGDKIRNFAPGASHQKVSIETQSASRQSTFVGKTET